MKKTDIVDISDLVKLKEQGMSDADIVKYLAERGIVISWSTVNKKLTEYYKELGKERPKISRKDTVSISIEELVKLKEQGMLDVTIAKMFNIKPNSVSSRLRLYYEKVGKEKPKTKRSRRARNKNDKVKLIEPKIFAELREEGMSDEEISEYLNKMGISISAMEVNDLLSQYYNSTVIRFDDEIKEILMCGMTIEEFINKYEKQEKEEIREKFEKLRVVAQYSKREKDEIVQDENMISVLTILGNPDENIKRQRKIIETYIVDGVLRKGAIQEIKDTVFPKNTDLMVYILIRLNVNLNEGYDERIFNKLKKEYENKIDNYLRRIEQTDNNRRQTQQENSALNTRGEGR